ncbi:MAG: D-amino acid dehydrogenase [Rubrivivax sp.]|nr:D-amino acid dehydrogenase [Rubrivivax sp.]MCL4696563.1 D-amino acid dehydrogenase [Burkholderiaceae bacterium]
MRVAVIGAGIVGVTTAHELAAQGQEVTVYERRGGVATETSFANAGVVAPGYVTPWAAPGMPLKVLAQLFARDAAVRFVGLSALRELPWMWRYLRACRTKAYVPNRTAMQCLAHYSRERLDELAARLDLDYEQRRGYMVLLRRPADLQRASAGLRLLAELGVKHDVLDEAGCRQFEPALSPTAHVHAAIRLPDDGVGNCRAFAHQLKNEAQRLGAQFAFDTEVRRMRGGSKPAVELADGQRIGFDHVVVCAGVEANRLLAPHGLSLPLAPVYGYSITAPLREHDGGPDMGPRSALMDEKYKVAISRLGQRVRVAGSAEIGGRLDDLRRAPLATLYRVLDEWFPGAASMREVQQWKGARPMLPDGPPVIGACRVPGIWLNLGHGSSGWALACGSARLVADAMLGRPPAIDVQGLTPARLHR